MGAGGPKNPTPLALAFYKAYRESGRTYKSIAAETDVSWQTVAAYISGTRGGDQNRSERTIRQIAAALGMEPDQAVDLSGIVPEGGAERGILADPTVSRRDKEELLGMLRGMRRRRR